MFKAIFVGESVAFFWAAGFLMVGEHLLGFLQGRVALLGD